MTYTSVYENPRVYFKAKSEITRYIEENYKDALILEGVSYSSKMGSYLGKVRDKDDSRCKSFIEYHHNSGRIYDDYHFRTITGMEDEITTTISTLISTSCDIPRDKVRIAPHLETPKFKYRMFDKHDPNNPVDLNISVKVSYANMDKFSEDACKILNTLYATKLKFKNIELYSFTPEDGNRAYCLSLNESEKASSLEDIKKTAYVKWMGK